MEAEETPTGPKGQKRHRDTKKLAELMVVDEARPATVGANEA
jgi:hypothetical protein